MSDLSVLGRAGALGFAAGLRSELPWAGLALSGLRPTFGPASLGQSRFGKVLTVAGAIGEVIADKLPVTPSRIRPAPLTARVASGGLVGASIASAFGRTGTGLVVPGLLGAAAAVAGSFAGYSARRAVTTNSPLPDIAAAVIEDGATVALVAAAVRPAG
jgi:uncharacterized membrane protein